MAYAKKLYQGGYNAPQKVAKQTYKKHSGAKLHKYVPTSGDNKGKDQMLVTAWKLNRNKELISVKAVTTSKTRLSEKGWYGSIAVTLTNTVTGEQNFHWGMMQKSTGKVVVSALALVINPKAKNGGYCGTFVNSDN